MQKEKASAMLAVSRMESSSDSSKLVADIQSVNIRTERNVTGNTHWAMYICSFPHDYTKFKTFQ